jgi:CDP-diacylglycerol---glycerol-3-phosphate 3-phosphatidyltransferase
MVIIAREFAVTALRMAATQQGVGVIPASLFGKAKTCLQIAAVLALIAAGDASPLWVELLVYATVAVTVASGVELFLGLRRRLGERDRAAADSAG